MQFTSPADLNLKLFGIQLNR